MRQHLIGRRALLFVGTGCLFDALVGPGAGRSTDVFVTPGALEWRDHARQGAAALRWWQRALIYQIYPLSHSKTVTGTGWVIWFASFRDSTTCRGSVTVPHVIIRFRAYGSENLSPRKNTFATKSHHFRTSVAATTSPVSAGPTRPNRSRKGAVFLAEHTTRATTDKIV
jgi:hypothetical protein